VKRYGLTNEQLHDIVSRWENAAHKYLDGDRTIGVTLDLLETWPFFRGWAPVWRHPIYRLVVWYYISRHLSKLRWKG
jgi:hypothetical protein